MKQVLTDCFNRDSLDPLDHWIANQILFDPDKFEGETPGVEERQKRLARTIGSLMTFLNEKGIISDDGILKIMKLRPHSDRYTFKV